MAAYRVALIKDRTSLAVTETDVLSEAKDFWNKYKWYILASVEEEELKKANYHCSVRHYDKDGKSFAMPYLTWSSTEVFPDEIINAFIIVLNFEIKKLAAPKTLEQVKEMLWNTNPSRGFVFERTKALKILESFHWYYAALKSFTVNASNKTLQEVITDELHKWDFGSYTERAVIELLVEHLIKKLTVKCAYSDREDEIKILVDITEYDAVKLISDILQNNLKLTKK